MTDSRIGAYLRDHGDESWELDALDPSVLVALIRTEVAELIDQDAWDEAVGEETEARGHLAAIAERFDDVRTFLEGDA